MEASDYDISVTFQDRPGLYSDTAKVVISWDERFKDENPQETKQGKSSQASMESAE